jgi:hypothetical protein
MKTLAAALAASGIVAAGLLGSATPAEAGRKTGFQNSKLAKYGYAPRGYYGPHRHYYRSGGYYRGNRGVATGVGIAAGALAIGAIAGALSQPAYAEPVYQQPVYGYGQPAYGYGYAQPVYYRHPVCRVRYQTVWDPYYGYVQQPVQVCR